MADEENNDLFDNTEGITGDGDQQHSERTDVRMVSGMYETWFLEYASYVILERAVPYIEDGLKPVQRRILHSMWEMEDGRYNKVANIIGNTMKFHPHGDASIGDALVQLGQKDLLIDQQGNWGNIYTGDRAAAPRYIEARLSKFALDVVFNPKTTVWQASYDGRNREPVTLPMKFPLLLAQGPFGTTTGSLIDSVIAANDKGKIKIRKIEDNTAEFVEVMIHLQPGTSTDKTIDALYAFTDCEVSISPNACIIENERPRFVGVNEMLRISTAKTLELLKRELEIELHELNEQWHFSSLEKIFIKEEMYIDFKKYSDRDTLYVYLHERFKPFKKKLFRLINDEDLHRLTQIPMIRITRFDTIKADEKMKDLEDKIEQVKHHLAHLVEFAIEYFKDLKKKYGAGRERKTEIRQFEIIEARQVVMNNVKLYANKEEGFIGTGLKKDEFICDCSDLDEIIIFRGDGVMMVTKVAEKTYVGKDIIHMAIFKKGDDKTVYNMAYRDGRAGNIMVKRFNVSGVTRDKEYALTRGAKDSKVHYFSVSPNGESEIITVSLTEKSGARKLTFDMDLSQVAVKGRDSQGNILTRYPVRKIVLKSKSKVAIKKQKVWFDDNTHRLNYESRGTYIGNYGPEDKILSITQTGHYRMTGIETSLHFDEDMIRIEMYDPTAITTCIYFDGESKNYFIKRFAFELTDKKTLFITENAESRIEHICNHPGQKVVLKFAKVKGVEPKPEKIEADAFIEVRNMKAKGNKLSAGKIKEIDMIDPFAEVTAEEIENEEEGGSPLDQLRKTKDTGKKSGPQGKLF
ncbi:MAG: DNA gyrase/topoisomerase IV subunit A [Bacteroidetes bacterium]|nr:DNA gyrase/topoisomerase IV subunit A [Bacteroidota bacterium]